MKLFFVHRDDFPDAFAKAQDEIENARNFARSLT
jgi:hypothetical protein